VGDREGMKPSPTTRWQRAEYSVGEPLVGSRSPAGEDRRRRTPRIEPHHHRTVLRIVACGRLGGHETLPYEEAGDGVRRPGTSPA
jgi:hypothetical protein